LGLGETAARAEGRVWGGPALALDPAFAAGVLGADYFFGSGGVGVGPGQAAGLGVGICAADTFAGAGDETAVERGYGFVSALARWRRLGAATVELLGGAGLAQVRFGSPGAHTEWAPDVVLGAALGWPVAERVELAVELATHVTLSGAAAARNPAHTSELLTFAVRWGLVQRGSGNDGSGSRNGSGDHSRKR
jgi:hypothetical protein